MHAFVVPSLSWSLAGPGPEPYNPNASEQGPKRPLPSRHRLGATLDGAHLPRWLCGLCGALQLARPLQDDHRERLQVANSAHGKEGVCA